MRVPPRSQRFGLAVRNRRIANGITQNFLAERSDLDVLHLALLECGLINPSLVVAARVANALEKCIVIRIRAEALIRAHGRCPMCRRTISRDSIELVVAQRIPFDWNAAIHAESYGVMCTDCQGKFLFSNMTDSTEQPLS